MCTCGMDTADKIFFSERKTEAEVNLVSVIFKSIKITKSSEISTKFNTKTLCLYRYGFFWCQKSLKTLQLINRIKAWIAINHNYHNL